MNLKDLSVDNEWTLFLDRDGVINKRIIDGYVTCREEFEFLPGVLHALKLLSGLFGRLIIITNQQGFGKGLMTKNDLKHIHDKMLKEIERNGGNITGIYYSPYLDADNHDTRKPNSGMAMQAKHEFPEINFVKSVMVGDSIVDMQFGKKLNMYTVYLMDETGDYNHQLIDFQYKDLPDFTDHIIKTLT
jgi:histidinol-phosphate phosphatase family protein